VLDSDTNNPAEVIAAGTGRAVRMAAGQHIEIINPAGSQVVDTWALCLPDLTEFLSVEHTRAALSRLIPRAGDLLRTNRREPVLTLVDDTSPGIHDTLIPACDPARYRQLGVTGYHANCHDNFVTAVRQAGAAASTVPNPLNLFMNIPWSTDGSLSFAPPLSAPGDLVRLRAERDLLLVMSACPQDLVPVNGALQRPADVQYRLS
jgi:uncharacterized protein YcgI (DUF1989 family)